MSGEKSGKDMLLKIAETMTAAITGGTQFTKAGHGLKAGDLIKFSEAEGTAILTSRFYFVTDGTTDGTNAELDGSLFSVALTPDGSAISVDATDSTVNFVAYKTIGGLRTSTASLAADAIDISNHGSNQWKELKAGAGMRSMSISGAGVYNNATNYRSMESSMLQNALVALAFLDLDGGRIYSASFKINSLEASGEYDGEASFSMSADSSGSVSVAQLGT